MSHLSNDRGGPLCNFTVFSPARTLDLSGLLGQLDLANLQDLLSNANEQTLQDILDDQTLQDLAQNLLNNLPDPGNDGAGAGGFLGNLFNGVRPPRRRPFRPVGPFRTVG